MSDTVISKMPTVIVRIEPNAMGNHILWNIECNDGTKSSGFAKCPADAMHDAAEFVKSMMQPRIAGLMHKAELRVVK